MDNKKMAMVSIVIFVLSLLVFIATIFLVFYKPQKQSMDTEPGKTENVEIGDISTQIGTTGRYYKGFVYLEVVGKKTPEQIEKKMPQVKDTILAVISGSEIKNVTGDLTPVKEEIKTRVNEILAGDFVVDVLFTESIVQ